MAIDLTALPPAERRGYEVEQQGQRLLRVTLRKEFDTLRDSDKWAANIVRACVGPYERVEINVAAMVMLSSTCIAGLVHLVDHFRSEGADGLTIVGANERVVRSLQMMKLDSLFDFADAV